MVVEELEVIHGVLDTVEEVVMVARISIIGSN
jgi:hypothetical protein